MSTVVRATVCVCVCVCMSSYVSVFHQNTSPYFQAWQNEIFAPELLEHKTEVVDSIVEQIKEMVGSQFGESENNL